MEREPGEDQDAEAAAAGVSGQRCDGDGRDRRDAHAAEQKARYAARRAILIEGLTAVGFSIQHSEAGLYLWATRPGLDCWAACELLAEQCGILVGPGCFYGPEGNDYIRIALTATDERVAVGGELLAAFAAR